MKIDKKLNFIIPIERETEVVYVHCTPLLRETFKRFYLILAQTFTAIYTKGVTLVSGPRVAALMLQEIAEADGSWDFVQEGLVNEIHRLANMIVLTEGGWKTVPLETALRRGALSLDEVDEVEGYLTFFIVASAMHTKEELPGVLERVSRVWGLQTSSLNCTEFAKSLPTPTTEDNTGKVEIQSSLPV
jgi:hypothetical protein